MQKIGLGFLLFVQLTSSVLWAQQTAQQQPAQNDLIYVLYVSRHGVRSPTGKAAQYDTFSNAAWPEWKVPPGYLTDHGYQLMKLFGAYDRQHLTAEHLFSPATCADADRVTFDADSDERTRETGKALAEGMFPGCPITVHALPEGTNDPLFHLPRGSITGAERELAAAAIAGRVGNDPSSVAKAYQAQLSALDAVLAHCGSAQATKQRTSLFDVPASISPGAGDHVAEMKGPLNTAATLTENLLLEYTEGMDAKDVGWGCVDGDKLRALLELHTEASELALRTTAVAVPQASPLLKMIDASIQQAVLARPVAGALGKPNGKALFVIGHDTNLSNLGGTLGIDWLLDDRRDDTPPGSALVFEVRRSQTGGPATVQLYFTAQTLEQMREASPLDALHPPPKVPVFLPGCDGPQFTCDATTFHRILQTKLGLFDAKFGTL